MKNWRAYGPVSSSGAADTHSQIALSFADVARDKVLQEVPQAPQEFLRFRELAHVSNHLPVPPAECPEPRHEKGVRQEPDVKQEVGLERDAVLVAETDQVDRQRVSTRPDPESLFHQ